MEKSKARKPSLLFLFSILFLVEMIFLGCSFQTGVLTDLLKKQKNAAETVSSFDGSQTSKPSEFSAQTTAEVIRENGAAQTHLWVDAETGSDENSGLSAEQAFRSVQQAADKASPGTIIHILPGVYRESIRPAKSGTPDQPIVYIAEKGPGTVTIRGSVSSTSLIWMRLTENNIGLPAGVDPSNIFYTDLSPWNLQNAPRFIVDVDENGSITSRWMPAREPDRQVATEWKFAEFWWLANGGSAVAECDPITDENNDCDLQWRSYDQLTDTRDDTEPSGVEPGNLISIGNLEGATLVAMDAHHSHYVYRGIIIQHEVNSGLVTIDQNCENEGEPGLGWGSKYYVENHPSLLDEPGEWWFDKTSGKLYIWSPSGENPALLSLEISRLDTGFNLTNRSYIILDGLSIDLYNQNAYQIVNTKSGSMAHGNQIKNCFLQYADKGIILYHFVQDTGEEYSVDGFLLEDSEIANMDTAGLDSSFWWSEAPSPVKFSYAGVRNLSIQRNEFHHIGFNSQDRSAVGIRIFFPDKIRFEGNHVHNIAQNGVHFHLSLIDSNKVYDISPEEIKIGEILVKDNIFEKTCQAASDCGGLKFSGSSRPYTHVFRDVLITGNIFRHTFGWSYVSILRHLNTLGDGNGFYLDNASGVHVYRNIAYNNSGTGFKLNCLWRDGDAVFYNNISANNYIYGWKFTGITGCDDHGGSTNTQLVNNILINNGVFGYQFSSASAEQYGNLLIDHNLYFGNGWDEQLSNRTADIQLYIDDQSAQYLTALTDIKSITPWEQHGIEKDPSFQDYSLTDSTRYGYSWPDFHPSSQSHFLLDTGSEEIPSSLIHLLERFSIEDGRQGNAYDIGRYEITEGQVSERPFLCDGIILMCFVIVIFRAVIKVSKSK